MTISCSINHNIDLKQNKLYIGIFWKIASCFCFAGVNSLVRYLSGGSSLPLEASLPIYTIMFFQNTIGAIILIPMLLKNKDIINSILKTKHPFLHTVRVTTAVLGIGLFYLSLQYIPLTQVVALSFAAPFISIIGAVIFLNESLNINRIIVIILSIIGGFLISRPDLGLVNSSHIGWLAIFPILATLIFALDKLITRKLLLHNESPAAVTLLLIAFTAPFCLIPAILYGWHTPHLMHWPWLILLAIFGIGAHFTFSKAFYYAEVTVLIPFSISKIVFCGIIGYIAFAELPKTADMWLGIIVTTISAIILGYDKQKKTTR